MSTAKVSLTPSHSTQSFDKYEFSPEKVNDDIQGEKNLCIQAPGPGERLVVTEGSIPETPSKGVVLKVHCTGICHSDVHIWSDTIKLSESLTVTMQQLNPGFKWPFILGHEISGEVYSLGEESTNVGVKKGDRVALFPWVGCGACGSCTHGDNNLCSLSIIYDVGIGVSGGYQCYVAINDSSNVIKLSDDVDFDIACMFGCSALTAYNACKRAKHSVDRAAKNSGDAKFLIIGAGGLGLWTIQMAKAIFPPGTKIIVADVDDTKLNQAKENGADETLLWPRGAEESEMIEKTKEVTGGIDGSVDFVGLTVTIGRAFQAANKGATIVQVGLAGGTVNLSLVELALKDITVSGVYVGNKETMSELIELYSKKKLLPPPINHVKPEEAADALQKLKEGKIQGRSIICFT